MKQKMTDEQIKEVLVEILAEFDRICKDNHLKYSVAGGTLLGAVRHKGFIPWDDDIDIVMLRSDYDKLVSLHYESDHYIIKNHSYSKNYYYIFSKIMDKRTALEEFGRAEKDMGVYIDIMPLDFLPDDKSKWARIFKKARFNKNLIDKIGSDLTFNRSFSLRYAAKLIFKVLIFPFRNSVLNHIEKSMSKYKKGEFCSNLVYNIYGSKAVFRSDLYKNIIYLDFENIKAAAFKDYDSYLKTLFHNYMELPPVEERVTHHNFIAYKK